MEFKWFEFLLLISSVVILGLVSLHVYKHRAEGGFGPYNSSTLIIIIALTTSGVIGLAGVLDKATIGNIIMGVIGFAGGIVAGKKEQNPAGSGKSSEHQ
ncbi:hypothetical protein ACK38R_20065 [Aeromonas veronii]